MRQGREVQAHVLCSLVFAALTFLVQPGMAQPAPCVNIKPVPGPIGYSLRPGGRCEGLYITQVAAQPVELVGFYANPPPPLGEVPTLFITAPGIRSQGSVAVVGVAVAPEVYYRLDARLTAAEPTLRIDGSQVLFLAELRFSDLAFTGLSNSRLAPLRLASSARQDGQEGSQYVVLIRTNRGLKALNWRIERGGPSEPAWSVSSDDLSAPYRLGQLRFAAGSGEADLVIKAQDNTDAWTQSRTALILP
jgi:hypothetical protein